MHLGFDPDALSRRSRRHRRARMRRAVDPAARRRRARDCKIIHIGADPLFASYPLRGFPCDLAITGVIGATLPALTEALSRAREARAGRASTRAASASGRRAPDAARQVEGGAGEGARTQTPMHPAWITHCLNQVKGDDAIVIKESPLTFEHMRFTKPGTFYSLGRGRRARLGPRHGARRQGGGARQARDRHLRRRRLHVRQSDRRRTMSRKAEKLPILTVVFNNEMWGAVKRNTREVYPDGYAAKSNREPLTYFEPALEIRKSGRGRRTATASGSSDPADMPRRHRPRAQGDRRRPPGAAQRDLPRAMI